MIVLKVEEYCQECPCFKPVSETKTFVGGTNAFDIYSETRTVVSCANAEICENLLIYLKDKQKEGRSTEQ